MKPLTFRDVLPRGIAIPPVTGVRGSNAPHANFFDGSGIFRNRQGSFKRPRRDGQDDLLDSVYDLTRDFPPVTPPERPALDVASIKQSLVEATSMAEALKPVLDKDETAALTPLESKLVISAYLKLVKLVEDVVEKGVEPLSTAVLGVSGNPAGRGYAAAARRLNAQAPPTAPRPEPGKRELQEALSKAETESVLFGANLGDVAYAHRGTLNINFTSDLRKRTLDKAEGEPQAALNESLRLVEDALACVDNLDFLGQRSKPYKLQDGADSGFCSMPVKLSFADRDSRINFERTVREKTGLRVTQSLPQPIRDHMAAFRKALEDRYAGQIVMVRHDTRNLSLTALRKTDGEGRWTQCNEELPIPVGIMLPGFRAVAIQLPPVEDDDGQGPQVMG